MDWNDEILFEEDAQETEVSIREDEDAASDIEEPDVEEPEGTEEEVPEGEAATVDPEKPVLTELEVADYLGKQKVNRLIADRLRVRAFADLQELAAALESEVEYVKRLVKSGRPFSVGETAKGKPTVSLDERDKKIDEINKKYLR